MKGKIFNAQEVQAIIAGNKTMFREVVKNANYDSPVHSYKDWKNNGLYYPIATLVDENSTQTEIQYSFDGIKCPYQVGQKIFCKEGFLQKLGSTQLPSGEHETFFTSSAVEYVANGAQERFVNPNAYCSDYWKKRPAQHMKQEHSRLTLLIKEIRVEKVAEISEEDAIAEGVMNHLRIVHYNPVEYFRQLWNTTHKKLEGKFEANPWVWVIHFEVVK